MHLSTSTVTRDLPSIFAEDDNVYNTYALPSEDPRKAYQYANTGARTPRAIKRNATASANANA